MNCELCKYISISKESKRLGSEEMALDLDCILKKEIQIILHDHDNYMPLFLSEVRIGSEL